MRNIESYNIEGMLTAALQRNIERSKHSAEALQDKVIAIHGNHLVVDITSYSRVVDPVTVYCKIHDITFSKTPGNLIHKSHPQGCPQCTKDKPKVRTYSTYRDRWFAEYPVMFYYIKIGRFYKVGCTKYDVPTRYRMEKHLDIELLYSKVYQYGGNAYRIEHEFLKLMQSYRYSGAEVLYKGHGDSELLLVEVPNFTIQYSIFENDILNKGL